VATGGVRRGGEEREKRVLCEDNPAVGGKRVFDAFTFPNSLENIPRLKAGLKEKDVRIQGYGHPFV